MNKIRNRLIIVSKQDTLGSGVCYFIKKRVLLVESGGFCGGWSASRTSLYVAPPSGRARTSKFTPHNNRKSTPRIRWGPPRRCLMMIIEKNLMIESGGVTGSGDARQSLKDDVTQNRRGL